MKSKKTLISIVIPLMNEEENIRPLYDSLSAVFLKLTDDYSYEFIFVDDGSTDKSVDKIQEVEDGDSQVRLIRLARNFGKEIAITAGLHHTNGDAAIMIDADLQHPPELIPEFLALWQEGYDVVAGRRHSPKNETSFLKRTTSRWFYRTINTISSIEITANTTDYRLLDRTVIDEFNRFTERNRMTRGLIDWLGFSRAYIDFVPAKRLHGQASYGYRALMKLALNSMVSLSFFPLRLAGYVGGVIVIISGPLGVFVFIDRFMLNNSFHFTGSAILAVVLLFLVGIILICLGLIALYIANIHGEVVNRPLYVEKRRPPHANRSMSAPSSRTSESKKTSSVSTERAKGAYS